MRKVESHLRYSILQSNGGRKSSASNGSGSNDQKSNHKVSQHAGKRKTRPDRDLRPDEDEEDGANKRRRRSSAATIESSSETGARFACPFYKHDPNRFRNRRTCPGPGWPTVHRMKEHLYRAHAQSIYCPRCYATFDADTDLCKHLRSTQCSVSAPQPVEGIDRATLQVLRKRSPTFRLEEDKWRDAYHVLFPSVEEEDIPSPFYNVDDAPSEESRRFRRELLRRIQQELVTTADRLPHLVEYQLLQQVAGIIRRCEEDMLNSSFDGSHLTAPILLDTSRRPSDFSIVPSEGSLLEPTVPSVQPDNLIMELEGVGDCGAAPEHQIDFRPILWQQPQALDFVYTDWTEAETMLQAPGKVWGDDAFEVV
ncbi:hypothetical protein ACEQ8H_008468 [Pleosporales sp. CAS-2024a]